MFFKGPCFAGPFESRVSGLGVLGFEAWGLFTLRTLNYGNSGIFLILGSAGLISSAVRFIRVLGNRN